MEDAGIRSLRPTVFRRGFCMQDAICLQENKYLHGRFTRAELKAHISFRVMWIEGELDCLKFLAS